MASIPLYNGEINANRVGGFIKAGLQFDVIRPGYDTQARRRKKWTQVVHDGVPVYTAKVLCPISDFLRRFDASWAEWIGDDTEMLKRCLDSNKAAHLSRFKDGITGVTPAPTYARDGPMQPKTQRPS